MFWSRLSVGRIANPSYRNVGRIGNPSYWPDGPRPEGRFEFSCRPFYAKVMILDYALISLLLVAAHLLRSRVRLLQDLLLPAPLLAGFLALAAGKQGLDLLPFQEAKSGTPAMASYPAELVAIIF